MFLKRREPTPPKKLSMYRYIKREIYLQIIKPRLSVIVVIVGAIIYGPLVDFGFLNSDLLATFIQFLIIVVPLLGAIAYFTLAERKILGAIQRRRGPNVVGAYGLLQPLADGFKLLVKETIIPSNSNKFIFILSPILTFTLSLIGWAVIPYDEYASSSRIPIPRRCSSEKARRNSR